MPRTEYDTAAAAAYVHARAMRPADMAAWMAAARPHLPTAGGRVLDLGSGTGRFTTALAATCPAAVIACEPAPAMRAICRASCPPGTVIVAGTAEALPFAATSFDAVWASQVIHHVDNLPAFAHGLRRVLRPGGTLLLRGGFGPATDVPLQRYFPQAWSDGAGHPPLTWITTVMAEAGLRAIHRMRVAQTFATGPDELLGRVRARALSPLVALPDTLFNAGLRHLESDAAAGALTFPLVEHLDLVVFQR